MVQRVYLATTAGHKGMSNRGGRDEAAAENDSHEGDDKANQSERKNGCEEQLVGQ